MSCTHCHSRRKCLANAVPISSDIEKAVFRSSTLKKGQALTVRPDLSLVYTVKFGAVKLVKLSGYFEEQIVGFYDAGDMLSPEILNISGGEYRAVSLQDAVVCELSYDRLIGRTLSRLTKP